MDAGRKWNNRLQLIMNRATRNGGLGIRLYKEAWKMLSLPLFLRLLTTFPDLLVMSKKQIEDTRVHPDGLASIWNGDDGVLYA